MEIIDQVRQAASIIELASQYTTLRQRGRKHVGLCPFHTEKTPSFTVDGEKGLYHCFGCGVGGDVFTLVMEKENLNFPEAVKYLADKYHIPVPEQRKISPQALKLEEQVQKINESALAFFRKNLVNTPEGKKAQDYLQQRGIPEKAVQDFKLGYAMNSWDALVSYFRAKGVQGSLLEKSGLVLPGKRPGENYDRFRGRVIFPIFSMTGKVVAFGGRTLFDADPKYLNSPDTPVYSKGRLLYGLNFSKDAIRDRGEAILVEGYTDFLALFLAGNTNVVASCGTALTPQQVGLIQRFAPRVIINYDGDAAGRNAAFRAVPLFFEKGLETRVLILPGNIDPDGFMRKNGPEAYARLLETAVSGLKYIVDASVMGKRMNVPEVKTKVLRSLLAILENIPDSIVRSEYLKQVAEFLKVDENLLRELSGTKSPVQPSEGIPSGLLPAEKRILQILFENKKLRGPILAELGEESIKGLKSEPIFEIIFDCSRKDRDLIFHEIQKAVSPSLAGLVSQVLFEREDSPSPEEVDDCVSALRRTHIEQEIKALQEEIARLEKQGEKDKLRSLLARKQDLTRQLMELT
jgi:DNA primase